MLKRKKKIININNNLKKFIKFGKSASKELKKIIPLNYKRNNLKKTMNFLKKKGIIINSSKKVNTNMNYENSIKIYLKEINARILLTRNGEIEIAKNIEYSKNKKLYYLIQMPFVLQKMGKWYSTLVKKKIFPQLEILLPKSNNKKVWGTLFYIVSTFWVQLLEK